MTLTNTNQSYGSIAKFLHWLIAIIVICLLFAGYFMGDIADKSLKLQVFNLHKLFGLSVLALILLRLLWRLANPVPLLPPEMALWERTLEKTVKAFFYIALFVMPLSGWIFSTADGHAPHLGNIKLAAPFIPLNKTLADDIFNIHSTFAIIIIGLLCLHIAGALKHHFINKDNVLRRMLPKIFGGR